MTMDMHEKNKTLVDRLRAEGSVLSIEAADKIEALRRRGKHWERQAKHEQGKFWRIFLEKQKNIGLQR